MTESWPREHTENRKAHMSPSEMLQEPTTAAPAVRREDNAEDPSGPGETLYLTGRPTLKRFLRFVRSQAVHPEDEATLIAEWQAAKARVRKLK